MIKEVKLESKKYSEDIYEKFYKYPFNVILYALKLKSGFDEYDKSDDEIVEFLLDTSEEGIFSAIGSLSERESEIIELRFQFNWSYNSIGKYFKRSGTQISKIMHDSLWKLRERRYMVFYHSNYENEAQYDFTGLSGRAYHCLIFANIINSKVAIYDNIAKITLGELFGCRNVDAQTAYELYEFIKEDFHVDISKNKILYKENGEPFFDKIPRNKCISNEQAIKLINRNPKIKEKIKL
jgi:hypothetical protein